MVPRLLSFPHLFTLFFQGVLAEVLWYKGNKKKHGYCKITTGRFPLHDYAYRWRIRDENNYLIQHVACCKVIRKSVARRDGKVIVENNNIYCHSSAITSLGVKWLTTTKQSSNSNKNDEKSPEIFARATIICSVPSDVNCYYKLLWRMRFTGENIHILMTFRNILIHTVVIWHYTNVPGQSRNYNFWQFTLRHHVFLSKLLL